MKLENRIGGHGSQFFDALVHVECDFFDGYVIIRHESQGRCFLQIEGLERMENGRPNTGRKYFLSHYMTDDEVRQTAFAAMLAFIEHELRESFTYRGVAILGPHLSHDKLVDFIENGDALSLRATL